MACAPRLPQANEHWEVIRNCAWGENESHPGLDAKSERDQMKSGNTQTGRRKKHPVMLNPRQGTQLCALKKH